MRMSYERYLHLVECVGHPHLSARSRLIGIRRICRHAVAQGTYWDTHYRGKIKAAAKGLPFTAAIHTGLIDTRESLRSDLRKLLCKMGQCLAEMDGYVRQTLTFEQVAEIFCVNRVHWVEARAYYDDQGLLGLLWVGKLEDSATFLPGADKAGFWLDTGPTAEAVSLYMTSWMAENSDKLPDPFAPGGPFYGVPTYTMQPDGSMKRNAPALVVHSSDGGKRVVERSGRPA